MLCQSLLVCWLKFAMYSTVDLELNRIWYILFQVDLDNEEFGFSPVLAPTLKDARTKEELTDTTPAKPSGATGRSTPASATPSKGKRKASTPGEETKINTNKKAKSASEKVGWLLSEFASLPDL